MPEIVPMLIAVRECLESMALNLPRDRAHPTSSAMISLPTSMSVPKLLRQHFLPDIEGVIATNRLTVSALFPSWVGKSHIHR